MTHSLAAQPQKFSKGAFGANIFKIEGRSRAKETHFFGQFSFKKCSERHFKRIFDRPIKLVDLNIFSKICPPPPRKFLRTNAQTNL